MNIHSEILLITGLLLSSTFANAQVACVSGSPSQSSMVLQMSQAKAKSSVTDIIYKQYQLRASTQAKAPCVECNAATAKRPEDLAQVSSSIQGIPAAPKMIFNPACLKEAAEYKVGTKEIACPGGKKTKNICQTEEMLTYQNAVVSSFMSCANKLNLQTVSPAVLYRIYSLESGFKPQFASKNGVGLGQLTSIFVKDVHQAWRGGEYLNKIAMSDLKECEAAKVIAKKDMNGRNPPLSNSCAYIQLGEGMERNILYTMIGMATSWEKDLLPKMKSYVQKYANHPALEEVKSLTMASAYSAGGRAAGRAIASRLGHLAPDAYLKAIKKPLYRTKGRGTLNPYVLNMDKRQNEISTSFVAPLKSLFEKEGSKACVNQ